jgi:hypothetical protein
MAYVFYDEIREMFGDVESYSEDREARTVRFIFYWGVSPDLVFRLSDLLGSRRISWNEKDSWGGCPTCGHGAGSSMEFKAHDVVFPPENETP